MKLMMAANMRDGCPKYGLDPMRKLLRAQIENSVECGWRTCDIIIVANFFFQHMGVMASIYDMRDYCLKGSKVFALEYVWRYINTNEVVWTKDLDVWQNCAFSEPKFKDVGISCYSRPKYNGGSVFWRRSGIDILRAVIFEIEKGKAGREEPTLNRVFKSEQYQDRVTVLNTRYNIGCSGYVKRMDAAERPIVGAHFNPLNRIAWETHRLDRNGTGDVSVSGRLEILLRRYWPELSTELDVKKLERSREKKLKRKKKKGG